MRLLLSSFLFLFILNQSVAYSGFGIQVNTGLSFSRISDESDGDFSISGGKNKIKLGVGFIYDHQIKENAFFSTGLMYKTKFASYKVVTDQNQTYMPAVNLQYLELPVALKLYTNEFGDGFTAFAQFGFNFDFKLAEKYMSNDDFTEDNIDNLGDTKMIKMADLGLIMGLGMEYEISDIGQYVYAAILYNRGLLNVKSKNSIFGTNNEDLLIRNDIVDLAVGFKF